jgi:hypothetical protein
VREQMDLYVGVIVTLMFLAGCFFIIVSVPERSEQRGRWRGSTAAKPRPAAESRPL